MTKQITRVHNFNFAPEFFNIWDFFAPNFAVLDNPIAELPPNCIGCPNPKVSDSVEITDPVFANEFFKNYILLLRVYIAWDYFDQVDTLLLFKALYLQSPSDKMLIHKLSTAIEYARMTDLEEWHCVTCAAENILT